MLYTRNHHYIYYKHYQRCKGGYIVKPKMKLLTASDVARYCGVSSVTVSRWIRGNKLKAYTTPGGHYRIRKQDFRKFLEASGLPIDEQYFSNDG